MSQGQWLGKSVPHFSTSPDLCPYPEGRTDANHVRRMWTDL